MARAEILRSTQNKQYALVSAVTKINRILHPLAFNDLYSCTDFISRLDTTQSSWLRIANNYDGFADWRNHHLHSPPEHFIAELILQQRAAIYAVNAQAVTLSVTADNPLTPLLGFMEPSALLARPVIKQWVFQEQDINRELRRLNLQPRDYQALTKVFGIAANQSENATLQQYLLKGKLLLVSLPRSGSISRASAAAKPASARLTTPPSSTFVRPTPNTAVAEQSTAIAAQVKSLKLAATNGAAFCEKCNGVTPAPQPIAAPAIKAVSPQALALKQAAANGYAYCERCPAPKAAAS